MRTRVFLAREVSSGAVSWAVIIDGGVRFELRDFSSSLRALSFDSDRPAIAHLMFVGRWVVIYSAVHLPVYPVAPRRTMSRSRFDAIDAVNSEDAKFNTTITKIAKINEVRRIEKLKYEQIKGS